MITIDQPDFNFESKSRNNALRAKKNRSVNERFFYYFSTKFLLTIRCRGEVLVHYRDGRHGNYYLCGRHLFGRPGDLLHGHRV